jgi:hypothetical protein
MNLPGELDRNGDKADARGRQFRPGDWVRFAPMAHDGVAWAPIATPKADARAACMAATAHIHLFQPVIKLRDLDTRAEAAIRSLEDGVRTVIIIDDAHRVDRIDLCPAAGRCAPVWLRPARPLHCVCDLVEELS